MEETHQIDKGFWIEGIKLPDENGNVLGNHYAGYKGKIKVSLGKPKKDYNKYVMMFKTVLPDHIHSKLKGRTIERNRGGLSNKTEARSYENLQKTISAESLNVLIENFEYVVEDYLFVLQDEKMPREKTIFVRWKSNFNLAKKSYYNGSLLGKDMSMEFHYFTGYFNGRTIYDAEFREISSTRDKQIYEYKRIQWTQEREEFFDSIYSNFEKFKEKLEEFFGTLDEKTIDTHMSNFKLLESGK